jgi:DNA (cytosine-5)-methyltransferase 1
VSILPVHEPAGKPPRGALTAGSLCTGYGGLDLAVMAVTGARLAWTAETDKYAAAVLARHWPDVPNLGDVAALDWATVPPVHLVSAGWPCQDISYAGPGAGITEGTRSGIFSGGSNRYKSGNLTDRPGRAAVNLSMRACRVLHLLQLCTGRAPEQRQEEHHTPADVLRKLSRRCSSTTSCNSGVTPGEGLWLKIADGLRHLRPAYVFLENVAALRTRGLGKVLGDLAALGYDAQWVCLRAADAGAPHRRDRLLILGVRPGEAARLAAAADPGGGELQRRGGPADVDGAPGPAEAARP